MNTIAGAAAFACSNRSRTRAAPTPTNISTKSDPLIEKNGTPASPATARASSVLPVPGGPNRSTPRGIFAPIAWNLAGDWRYSLTSSSSSIASSTPATSANVVFGWSFDTVLCRLRPNCMTRPPPPCERFITQSRTPAIRTTGRITVMSVLISVFGSCGSESYGTPASSSSFSSSSPDSARYCTRYVAARAS